MEDLADPDTDLDPAPQVRVGTGARALRYAAEQAQVAADEAEAAAQEAKAVALAARARALATLARQRAEDAESSAHDSAAPARDEARNPDADAVDETVPEQEAAANNDAGEGDSAPEEFVVRLTKDSHENPETAPPSRLRRLRARAPRGTPRRIALTAAALVVIIASAGTSGYSLWHHHQLSEKDRRAAEFTAAARQGVIALTSLDFNHAKDDVQRVLDNSAGAFHDDFQGRSEDFTKVVQQSQVTTAGKVNASAVESMTEDSAVILVAATSQITNSAGAQQEPRVWRLSVTVSRVGGQLKISKVEFVP